MTGPPRPRGRARTGIALLFRPILILSFIKAFINPLPATAAMPQPPQSDARTIRYTVDLAHPQTQNVEMSMTVRDVRSEALDVALPVWRPGRYVVLDPAGTISRVAAVSPSGQALPITKIDKSTWRITTLGASEITVTYRVYANSLGDRTRHVDDTHAFLSPAMVFLYAPERRASPISVRIKAPEGWAVATGLDPVEQVSNPPVGRVSNLPVFHAADYDQLVDSPFEIGLHDLLEFEVRGVPHEIVIWSSYTGIAAKPRYDADKLRADFARIVEEESKVFGDMPYQRYVFMLHVGPGFGGGTEHINSTLMQTGRASLEDPDAYKRFLGLVAHEFFHTWNVKRLRPAGLSPYDYAHENYTPMLWVAEGSTSYFDEVCLVRCGLHDADAYTHSLGDMIDAELTRPGRLVQSLEESSFDSWVKFNKSWPDSANTTVSFYSKGALVSLLLDMELRSRTGNAVSYDAVIREMYHRFPAGSRGYTRDDMLKVITDLTDSDFSGFFADYIAGTKELDPAPALKAVGLECIPPDPTKTRPTLGISLGDRAEKTVVTGVADGGPASEAGLAPEDEIVAMDGLRLRTADLDKRLKAKPDGESVRITFFRRDELHALNVNVGARPDGKWTVAHTKSPTESQIAAYESWLGQPWPRAEHEK